ncbi:lysis system i-spanin subunit Rz [Pseudomonas umsongensis]|uniref:lysis system i-spanin subunit Rz n=1 Tax=Pseudomonas umsongensis TaxID=198618 RepID=UPI0015B8F3EE|nr:lysis system i-spanin subunit Rz [Pseudomonas umsongensis]NWL18627.1 lysis protein [Pseudomonas umsongensis]
MGVACCSTWRIQNWRYGKQLAEQAGLHQRDLIAIGNAAAAQVRLDQQARLALEQRLSASEQTHYKELGDAQNKQDRMRDRLATADLRLSVLLTENSTSGCSVPTSAGTGGMVHGATRAQLNQEHARRIISITGAGDKGLIALAACQAYVREVNLTR